MRFVGAFVFSAALAACGSSEQPDPCKESPTFVNDILPIAQAKCISCHSTALMGAARKGAPDGFDFDTYESTMPNIAAFADAITSGREPPQDAMLATTESERATTSEWRLCGFPR